MSEVQGCTATASLPVSNNPPGGGQQNNNQPDTVDGAPKSRLQQVTDDLSTEQRLRNLNTPLDQCRGSGNQPDDNLPQQSAIIGRAAHSGSDLANHQNPVTTISRDVTDDAAKALLRNDLPPATAQQVKNIGYLANANPASAEFRGALAQLTRMAEISSQNSLAAGTKIAFDPEMDQKGVTKIARLPQLDVPKIDSDIYYKTADGTLHLDSAKATPNTLATEIKDSIDKPDIQLNRQQAWQQKSTSESPRQLGLYVLDEGSSKTGTGNLLHLNKLSQVVSD